MIPIVILGAGGHARMIADALEQSGSPARGYVAKRPAANFGGLPYLGDDDVLEGEGMGSVMLANGVGAVDIPSERRQVFDRYKKAGFLFVNVVHPSAHLGATATLGEGTQILAGAVVQSSVSIGRNVIINTGVIINHDCVIGNHTHVATGAVLAGTVNVGEACLVGAGVTLIQDLRIGSNVVIAAGATVIADIANGERVAGVPAKPMRRRA